MTTRVIFFLLFSLISSTFCRGIEIRSVEITRGRDQESNKQLSPQNVMFLGEEDCLIIEFDELSHNLRNFAYRIRHYDKNWRDEDFDEIEYVGGDSFVEFENYVYSKNTFVEYIHYSASFPSDRMWPVISGNYRIEIFEMDSPNEVVAEANVYVAENITDIVATLRVDTDVEVRGAKQQIDVEVGGSSAGRSSVSGFNSIGVNLRDNGTILVRQNGREDNAKSVQIPTSETTQRVMYNRGNGLIFDGGNEYREFDTENLYIKTDEVEQIQYIDDMFHATLRPSFSRNGRYEYRHDANGRFRIHVAKKFTDDKTESDYIWVHFFVPTLPFQHKSLYILGRWNNNDLTQGTKMEYVPQFGGYAKSFLLKQGGYSFIYIIRDDEENTSRVADFEGNFWQTENEYEVFVYYRIPGSTGDRLIGYTNKLR